MNPKSTLNWKQYFKNENMLTDALKFKDWDQQNLEIPDKQTLIKDLTRTRNDDPYFKKESTQRNMQLLATFYCQQNNVNYQQGMLEVVVPFLLLKNKDFPLAKCYAYLNSFMNIYFPKVLESKVYGERKELAHVMSAIQFSEILLKYHCADFYNRLSQMPEFNVSMVVTQWIMTLFAKGSPIPIVFLIFDQYMQRNNPNYIFYLVSAIFESKKSDIVTMLNDDLDMLLPYLNKELKQLKTENDVNRLFELADSLQLRTPKSYDLMIQSTSFHEKTVLSVEDVKELISWGENYKSKCLFMTTSELITLIKQAKSKDQQKQKQQILNPQKGENREIELRIVDIRKERKPKLKDYVDTKLTLKLESFEKKYKPEFHYCLITESLQSMEDAIKIQDQLFKKGFKYISILQGGFAQLAKIVKHPKDQGCLIM